MNSFFPILLTDTSRLQEIYDLRVDAWENSVFGKYINRQTYPNGWSDTFDKDAHHFIIIDETDRIIASSRFSLHDDFSNFEENFAQFNLPNEMPFGFYSRLVVLPEYRHLGIATLMDETIKGFIKMKSVGFTLASAHADRIPPLLNMGFIRFGDLRYDTGEESSVFILQLGSLKT